MKRRRMLNKSLGRVLWNGEWRMENLFKWKMENGKLIKIENFLWDSSAMVILSDSEESSGATASE